MKKENLLNKRFGRLFVIEKSNNINKRTAWKCKCQCGNICIVKSQNLKGGHTKSCGCLNNEKRSERSKNMYNKNIKYTPIESSARRIWKKRYNDGISFEDFFKLSQQNCYYCNSKPNNLYNAANEDLKASNHKKENGHFYYNGLDRLDSSKNHNITNVVSCCKWCNYAKRERSVKEFKDWIIKVYENINKIT